MRQHGINPIEEAVEKLKPHISEMVNNRGVYKISSCDHPNWDQIKHDALLAIVRRGGIEGIHISHQVNHGVTDWTFTKF